MAALASMRETLDTRYDAYLPPDRLKQEIQRDIARRVQRYDYRNRDRSSGDRIIGEITYRNARENRTLVQWHILVRGRRLRLALHINADVAAMGGSSRDARNQIMNWFRGI